MKETMPATRLKPIVKTAATQLCSMAYGLAHRSEESRYCILPGYRHRDQASYFDDTGNADQWQREVYAYAADVMRTERLTTVYDIGCGSAFKLVNYLGEFKTVGFDVGQTVQHLRRKYPARQWEVCDFSRSASYAAPDLVICADVIEHVPDPDELVAFIEGLQPKFVVLSTPDRNLVYHPLDRQIFGPPANQTHLREWNSREFKRYVSKTFHIVHHRISNREQATQMVFCSPISGRAKIGALA